MSTRQAAETRLLSPLTLPQAQSDGQVAQGGTGQGTSKLPVPKVPFPCSGTQQLQSPAASVHLANTQTACKANTGEELHTELLVCCARECPPHLAKPCLPTMFYLNGYVGTKQIKFPGECEAAGRKVQADSHLAGTGYSPADPTHNLTGGLAWQPWHFMLAALHSTPPRNHGPGVHEQGLSMFIFASNWEQNHPGGLKIPKGPSSISELYGLAKMGAPFQSTHGFPREAAPSRCLFTSTQTTCHFSLPQKHPGKIQVPPHGLQNPFLWKH